VNAKNASKKSLEAELLSILLFIEDLVMKALLCRGGRRIYLAIKKILLLDGIVPSTLKLNKRYQLLLEKIAPH
jgi:hypothetical protein